MSLDQFIASPDGTERSIVVCDRTAPEQVQSMLSSLFEDQPVEVREGEGEENEVLVLEDGEVVARSPLAALETTILFVNSDLYVTGSRGIDDVAFPDVLAALDDVAFDLRSYPQAHHEKLLLIVVSRWIERVAAIHDDGILRSGFQELSRNADERGTREVYEQLAHGDVDVHLYGQPDWRPNPEFDVTIHGGYREDFRRGWFVVYTPESDIAGERERAIWSDKPITHAALVAKLQGPGVWRGSWTYDPERVEAINRYIERRL